MSNATYPRKREAEKIRPPMSSSEVEFMLLAHLVHPVLFAEGRTLIKPEYFDDSREMKYKLLWSAALSVAEVHSNELPADATAQVLYVECQARLERAGGQFTMPEADYADLFAPGGVLDWGFSQPKEVMNQSHARQLRGVFITERTYRQLADFAANVATHGHSPFKKEKIQAFIEQLNSANSYASGNILARGAFDASLLTVPPPDDPIPWPTSLAFIDKPMGGGQCGGECNTLMGPTGVGKTTLAMQMAIASGRQQIRMGMENPEHVPGASVYFSWEQDYNKLLLKAWSYAAVIRLEREKIPRFSELTQQLSGGIRADGTRSPLKDYEMQIFADQINAAGGRDKYGGELGRLKLAMTDLGNNALRIVDMTDTMKHGPQWGTGGLDDILMVLKQLTAEDVKIGVVYIDYAGLLVDQYMAERGIESGQKRHYLKKLGMDCIRRIALPYRCPVWLLHQVNTPSNKKAPTAIITHADGEESGQMAQNAAYAFQLGMKDTNTNTCQLFCTKTRNGPPAPGVMVLKIEGEFSRMRDGNLDYMIDRASNRIVSREFARTQIGGPEDEEATPPMPEMPTQQQQRTYTRKMLATNSLGSNNGEVR